MIIYTYLDCQSGCYCYQPTCICICQKCGLGVPCPLGYDCKDRQCLKRNKKTCKNDLDCPDNNCCSKYGECKPLAVRSCTSSKDCQKYIEETHCDENKDTCMANGVCGRNFCTHDDDCYNGYYCVMGYKF